MAARRSSFSSTRAAAWAIVLANATSWVRSRRSPCTVRRKNTPAARPWTNTGSATAGAGGRPRVRGSGGGGVGARGAPAAGQAHDPGRAPERGCGREVAPLASQRGTLGADRGHHYAGGLVPRRVGAGGGGGVGRF